MQKYRYLLSVLILLALIGTLWAEVADARGSVSVRAYTRKDGTYVHAHTRSAPTYNGYPSTRGSHSPYQSSYETTPRSPTVPGVEESHPTVPATRQDLGKCGIPLPTDRDLGLETGLGRQEGIIFTCNARHLAGKYSIGPAVPHNAPRRSQVINSSIGVRLN